MTDPTAPLARLTPILPLLARFTFAAVLLPYFWASAVTKLGSGILGIFSPSLGAYAQIFPRAMEAANYNLSALGPWHWAVVTAGTVAEFVLPLMIVIGLFAVWYAQRYAFGSPRQMGPGFFPVVLGWVLAGLGVLILLPALRRHLDAHGFHKVRIEADRATFPATRLDPGAPWARFVTASLQRTAGVAPHVLPNLAGSLPNDVFADVLGLPTIWIPHSYRACSQHAPNEHVLKPVCRDALRVMAGVFWDLGEQGGPKS